MVMIVGDDDVDIDEDHNVDVDNYGATHPKTCSTEIVGRVLTTWPNPGNIIRCLSLSIHVAFEKVSISKTNTFEEKTLVLTAWKIIRFFHFLIAILGTISTSKKMIRHPNGPDSYPGFVLSHTFLETISSFSFQKSYHL